MKFSYGKQDWKTFERGEENCYLMTNGLGGFSSLSAIGSCSRNDQAVLMACLHAPNHRYNMIHRLEEKLSCKEKPSCSEAFPCKDTLSFGEREVFLSSQDYQCLKDRENGWRFQSLFTFEDYPQWTYQVGGVEIVKTIALMQGHNTVGISYRIHNRSVFDVALEVSPHLQFVKKGARMARGQQFALKQDVTGACDGQRGESTGRIRSNELDLYYRTNGEVQELPVRFVETLAYSHDREDGKMPLGRSAVNHKVVFEVGSGKSDCLTLVYGMQDALPLMEEIISSVKDFRDAWRNRAAFEDEQAQALAAAASQYISCRESTKKSTILAGYPFFEDWGRDTMIALTGCCLATGQYELTAEILQTFMAYCRDGLMPNLFPEGGEQPLYNTVDAALLFIVAVYEYYGKTKDLPFVKKAWPVMESIISFYRKGTHFGIGMDADGLIRAGQGFDQVTWMDVRVENILPTPRHGKPVEINAYWYNALCIMDVLGEELSEDRADYAKLAAAVKKSFVSQFWNEEAGCLKDVLSGTGADRQIRCNQIWAVSMPFSLLDKEREKRVVETVFRRLYTPYGLRTLAPCDEQFRPFYGGAQLDRDLSYHQGTVWTFPMGAYYLAYLKVNGYCYEAKNTVRRQLESLAPALREGCSGQLPEIYDGENPVSSKGCFAQAWSVGEILRVYDALRRED